MPAKIDFFVKSTETQTFSEVTGTGTSLDSPYLFLQQALNDVYSQVSVQYEYYTQVAVTIWLFKGSHHFFFCNGNNNKQCDGTVPLMHYTYPETDNIVLHVRALDCGERYKYFYNIGIYGSLEAFQDNCVDLSKAERPEVRVMNQYVFFNITNFAEF